MTLRGVWARTKAGPVYRRHGPLAIHFARSRSCGLRRPALQHGNSWVPGLRLPPPGMTLETRAVRQCRGPLVLQHIEGCEIASRRLPPSDSDIIEDDTDEQRHQQRATRNKKAHLHSPHSLGVSALLSPSQTRRGHLTATTAAMTATPVPAMRPAPWRRPRQPVHGQTSSHRKNRQSSAGPWQPLRQEQPRKERDGACDFSSAGKVPEAPLSATPRLSIRLC